MSFLTIISRIILGLMLAVPGAAGWHGAVAAAQEAHSSRAPKTPAVPRGAVRVSKVFGWRALDGARMIIWLGVSEPYVLTFAAPCANPVRTAPQWVSVHDGHIVPSVDNVGAGDQSCRIQRMAPVPAADRAAMRLTAPEGKPLTLKRHTSKSTSHENLDRRG